MTRHPKTYINITFKCLNQQSPETICDGEVSVIPQSLVDFVEEWPVGVLHDDDVANGSEDHQQKFGEGAEFEEDGGHQTGD